MRWLRAPIAGIASDSRKVQPGDVFFALAGAKDDGLEYAADARRARGGGRRRRSGETMPSPARRSSGSPTPAPRWRAPRAAIPRQPATIVAVTGTSGKTSVAAFARQIWLSLGLEAASLGTIGVVSRPLTIYGSLTTPDPIELHRTLDRLAAAGVTHLAMEASSHGLDQKRLDGVRLAAGAFTNLSRDHMDYHPTVEHYLAAKLRLFRELLPNGSAAVVDADSDVGLRVIDVARVRGLQVFSVGAGGNAIRLVAVAKTSLASTMDARVRRAAPMRRAAAAGRLPGLQRSGRRGSLHCDGQRGGRRLQALQSLEGAPGRLERIGEIRGAAVFVDYAHKPDALEKALAALRPYVHGRLILVFGCGGDRDAGKRPIMGEIAIRLADVAIVTDDNPRSENAAAIRAQILAAAPSALEIGDRAEAIRAGVGMLKDGDALLIAGKGHEIGQIVGDTVLPFSDADEARAALREAE